MTEYTQYNPLPVEMPPQEESEIYRTFLAIVAVQNEQIKLLNEILEELKYLNDR